MSPRRQQLRELLLAYVGLLAERHACGPDEGFEFRLWDDLRRHPPTLVAPDEQRELIALVIHAEAWVVGNLETMTFQLIDLDAWRLVLEHRDR